MNIIKIVSLLIVGVVASTLSIGTVEARGGHSHRCGMHKHLDQGTMHCEWNYGYKKPHHKY